MREIVADTLAVPVFKGGIEGPGAASTLTAIGLNDAPTTPGFRGDAGQLLRLAAPGLAAGSLLLVGLGRMDDVDGEHLRRAAATVARAEDGGDSVATTLAAVHPTPQAIQAVAEGLLLGALRRPRGAEPLTQATLLLPSSRLGAARAAIWKAGIVAGAALDAARLVDLPPRDATPGALAAAVTRLAGDGCRVDVRDEAQLAAEGFGCLSAVGRAASAPPRLVTVSYTPPDPRAHVVLVGKGITFDSGGLSLKSPAQLIGMKADMAGAAVVAAVCGALAALEVRVQVTGLLPLAENLPGADALRPGDVLTSYDGTTVEVVDTDAEGRLVLADALALAAGLDPDAIIDVATLTGSVIAGLGRYTAGLLSPDDELAGALAQAAADAGERVWRLPLSSDLARFLDSDVADVRQIADSPGCDPGGDDLAAALFLQRFVGDASWAHLDIAGPAFLPEALATDHRGPGATGFGVRTLLTWLQSLG